LEELVTQKFGIEQWKLSLKIAGVPESRIYGTFEDIPDSEVHCLLKAVSAAVDLPLDGVMEAFGDYWSTAYAPRVYEAYYAGAKNSRDLLLHLDDIHTVMTKSLKSARPPRFRYEWRGAKHLIMHYESNRGLVALMAGLVRGVGKYYGEYLNVSTVGNAVHIQFP
jgi:methyl-accepting chemotaxis protein